MIASTSIYREMIPIANITPTTQAVANSLAMCMAMIIAVAEKGKSYVRKI